MSGPVAITFKLKNNAPLVAVVPRAQIMQVPTLPLGANLPAITVRQISGLERLTASMRESSRFMTDRVQVTVHAKDAATLRQVLALVRAACAPGSGSVNGIAVDSILPMEIGPDLSEPGAGFFEQSQDFMVRWLT